MRKRGNRGSRGGIKEERDSKKIRGRTIGGKKKRQIEEARK